MHKSEPHYTWREEIANCVTHGAGIPLSITGLVLMVVYASQSADPWRVVSVSIFGATMVLLYLTSTLYHALPHPKAKKILRTCDHCAIYFLIAGTYTPFLLVSMRGPWGWSLFGTLWGITVIGCIFKICGWRGNSHKRWVWISTSLYLVMGWTVLVALPPLIKMVPSGGVALTALGGLAYTAGVVFYLWKRLPYNHAVWHLFVMGGTLCHFLAVFYFVVPG